MLQTCRTSKNPNKLGMPLFDGSRQHLNPIIIAKNISQQVIEFLLGKNIY